MAALLAGVIAVAFAAAGQEWWEIAVLAALAFYLASLFPR